MNQIIRKIRYLFKDGFFHIFVGSTMTKMIAFLSTLVVVRILTVEEYAYLTYVDNLYSYIGLFTGLGMSTAILKVCSPQTDKGEDKYYFGFSLVLGAIVQLSLSIFLVIYVSCINVTFPEARGLVFFKMFYPCMAYVAILMQNYLRAMGKNQLYAYATFAQSFVILIGSFLLAKLFNIYGVVLARYLGLVLGILMMLSVFIKQFYHQKIVKIGNDRIKAFTKMSAAIMLADIFATIIPINEMFLVSEILRDEVTTAYFRVAVLFPSQLMFVTFAIVTYVFPKVSQQKEMHSAYKQIVTIERYTFGFVAVIVVVGMLLNPLLIRILYGEEYLAACRLSNFYWLVYGMNAAIRLIPIHMLVAVGKAGKNAVITGVTSVLHFIVFYICLKFFGIFAAAIASATVLGCAGLASWVLLKKECEKGGALL